LTATSFGQSFICTRATSRYLPSSASKIEASPFLHIEPVLAQGIDDVGLVRDEEGVFALFWQPACGMISN